MATIEDLVTSLRLHKIDGILDAGEVEQRLIYIHPRAMIWLDTKLEGLENDGFYDNVQTPRQQVDDLLYEFISGSDIISTWPPHAMTPNETGIWELRTADLRFFGWFWRKGVFIMTAIDTKKRCKELSLYGGYRDQCARDRYNFDLDPPLFCTGRLNDVL